MTPKVVLEWSGKKYRVDSLEDLGKLLDFLEQREGLAPASRPAKPGRAVTLLTNALEQQLLKVLAAVRAQPNGLEAAEVSAAAGVEGPRGLGSVSRGWARVLSSMGFQLEEVLVRARDLDARLWMPGPRLAEAERELRRRAAK